LFLNAEIIGHSLKHEEHCRKQGFEILKPTFLLVNTTG